MHVTVAGKQVETGEALQSRVREGLALIARKYFDHALEAQVTFRRSRAFFACDINLHAGRGLSMRGEGEGVDAHRAFEIAADHVAKRLRRYRRRVNEHARGLAADAGPAPETARESVLAAEPDEEAETAGTGVAVVAETGLAMPRLTAGEAAMRLDLADLPVVVFRNGASGRLNVVYRRADGHIGWIDPALDG